MRRGVMFVIDIVITAIILAAVHLSIVLTFLTIFAMLYTAISNKISFLMVSLASLIGVVVFYISIIFVFGFGEYFEATSTELIVLGFCASPLILAWVAIISATKCKTYTAAKITISIR
jgi:hypothetical protein